MIESSDRVVTDDVNFISGVTKFLVSTIIIIYKKYK